MDPRDKSKREKSEPDSARGHSPAAPADPGETIPPGYISRDERGNAVWDWQSPTESTSTLLKKLEIPHLDMEEKKGGEASRAPPARDPGGGYDPYNQTIKPRRTPPRKG